MNRTNHYKTLVHPQLNASNHISTSCRVLAGLTWVSPNASLDRLDLNALHRWTGPRAERPVVMFDSMQSPDWYARTKHWHPWIPHNLAGFRWHPGHGAPSLSWDDEAGAKQDLVLLVKILGAIYRDLRPEGPKPDNAYRISDLDISLPQSQDQARNFMLSTSGYIRWLLAHRYDDVVECMKARLTSQDLERMQAWRLDLPGGVGVILDLVRDRREMNIGLYVRHGIPVYYPWTVSAVDDPTLYCLSPSYLLSQPHKLETSLPAPGVDFFFQPLIPGQQGSAMIAQKLPPLQHKVVDFEGWLPRSISKKTARLCFQSFYFEERWDQAQSGRLRIYHRFRLNANSKPRAAEPDVRDDYIRERWKFCHAPPSGQFYDTSTQQLMTGKSSVMLAVQEDHHSPVVILPSRPRHTEVAPMFLPPAHTISPGNSVAEVQVPPAVDSDAKWKEVAITVELEGRMQTFVLRLHPLYMPDEPGA
ncbi:uncharacterized protein EDB93DRAFT_1109699 [Suillus bovinus]|uniref:uncharacterized protein n=1 Tax=Suillus bovinus TaxID=48563 RepID=UPI001B86EB74|nr:uncharacterized protein EDB93DRAFT_1109699 [Suillus bovinus]KAG2126331.1 hypothetical protein EDB93DRAFT_1109699 [Suillus bovinus]